MHALGAQEPDEAVQRAPLRHRPLRRTGTSSRRCRSGRACRPGQMVGWTCLNEWHVHLSEWARVNGRRRWVNPLHAGASSLRSSTGRAPQIRAVYAYGPPCSLVAPGRCGRPPQPRRGDPARARRPARRGRSTRLDQRWSGLPRCLQEAARPGLDDRAVQGLGADPAGRDARDRLAADGLPERPAAERRAPDLRAVRRRARARRSPTTTACTARIPCDGRLFYHLIVVGGRDLWDTRSVANGAYTLTIRRMTSRGTCQRASPRCTCGTDRYQPAEP